MIKVELVKKRSGHEFLAEIEEKYGGIKELRKHVEKNPDDAWTEFDLLDAEHFRKNPSERDEIVEFRETRLLWSEEDLSKLTSKRLLLLSKLKENTVESISELADLVGRDYKNVYDDLDILEQLGLVNFESRGKSKIPSVMFSKIEIKI